MAWAEQLGEKFSCYLINPYAPSQSKLIPDSGNISIFRRNSRYRYYQV